MRGSGNVVTETRAVSGFDEIALGGIGAAIITQGETESLVVEAEDNLLPGIRTEIRDGRLAIDFERGFFSGPRPTRPIRFYIGVRDLKAIELLGAGSIEIATLRTDRLVVEVNGAGTFALGHLTAADLAITISGAGKVKVGGQVNTQEMSIAGAGEYRAADLETREARLTVDGAGRATVRVSDTLSVRIAGAGSVEYAGNPQVHQQLSGVGRVRQMAG